MIGFSIPQILRFSNKASQFSSTKFKQVEPSQSKVFIESVSSSIKGLAHLNHCVEYQPKLYPHQKANKKRFLIYRYNPGDPDDYPKYISYYVDLKQIPPMYLDALFYIKDVLDPTLSFRRSCREGICGSCSMNCNGTHTLACTTFIDPNLKQPATITPLGHMFVLKDLVVDMSNFYAQYKSIEPYLKRKTPKPYEHQHIVSQEERKKLDGLYECILCACCSTSCPPYWWHPEGYLGPAVLLQAYRWILDSRDEYTIQRLENLNQERSVDECQNIGMCKVVCPKGLDPQGAIQNLLKMLDELNRSKMQASS